MDFNEDILEAEYEEAAAELKAAQQSYGAAESRLIHAERRANDLSRRLFAARIQRANNTPIITIYATA